MTPRQSAAVYRRRRIVALGVLIVTLALLTALVWSVIARNGSGSSPSPSASPTATTPAPTANPTTPEAAPSTSPTPTRNAGPAPCAAADIQVKAVTDQDTYAADQNPQLSISLTNTGSKDCTMNVGTSQQVFTITSGSDTWWRSTDCQQNPSDAVQTVKAGATVTSTAPVVWDRTRSSTDTCGLPDRQRAPGGGAAYQLRVSIGGFESASTVQFLLS
jgi:hypothetical protein